MRKDSAGGGAAGRTRSCRAGLLAWTCLGAVTGCAVHCSSVPLRAVHRRSRPVAVRSGRRAARRGLACVGASPRPARHLLERRHILDQTL